LASRAVLDLLTFKISILIKYKMGNTGGKIKEGGAEFIGVFKPKSNRKKK